MLEKKKKKISKKIPNMNIDLDAGNVEYNVSMFNHIMGSGDISNADAGGLAEASTKFASHSDTIIKRVLDKALVMPTFSLLTDNDIVCYTSAINNIFYFNSIRKACTLYLGSFGQSNTISHAWVECDGKIYQTHIPANFKDNADLYSIVKIDIPVEYDKEKIAEVITAAIDNSNSAQLVESKEDIKQFTDKFGQELYDLFIKSKDRLKNHKLSTDILYYVKNTSKEELQSLLHSLQSKVTSKEQTEPAGKYKYLGEANDYKVYAIYDHVAAASLSVGAGWCIGGRYGHAGEMNFKPSLEEAKRHFNEYTAQHIKFYYFLDAKSMVAKYALALYQYTISVGKFIDNLFIATTNFELYNAEDSLVIQDYTKLPLDLMDKPVDITFVEAEHGFMVTRDKLFGFTAEAVSADGTLVIPEGIKFIDGRVLGLSPFAVCLDKYKVKHVVFPKSLIEIPDRCCAMCESLVSIKLQGSITYLREEFARECPNLQSVELPEGVKVIQTKAFYSCVSLADINLPDTLELIESKAFFNCASLHKIQLPGNYLELGSQVFSYSGLETLTIPAFTHPKLSIKDSAASFYSCLELQEVMVESSVISGGMFRSCPHLGKVILKEPLTYLGPAAFDVCFSLQELTVYLDRYHVHSDASWQFYSPKLVLRIGYADSNMTAEETRTRFIQETSDYCVERIKDNVKQLIWLGKTDVLTESVSQCEDIEVHSELNPILWNKDNTLDEEIQEHIELIVDKFKEYIKDNNLLFTIKDAVIVGSNANYNYSKDSDIDIHLIVDSEYDDEQARAIADLTKASFNNKYEIKLKGLDAEIYLELNELHVESGGAYSLKDGWIREPEKVVNTEVSLDKDLYAVWEHKCKVALDDTSITPKVIKSLLSAIYKLRKDSLENEGEFGTGNLVFKELRNNEYLSKLKDKLIDLEVADLSLESAVAKIKNSCPLTESKADIQQFVDKFGEDTYQQFLKSKDRLKNNNLSTDILFYVKNVSPKALEHILHNLQSKVKTDDVTKQIGKYDYLGESDGFKVYAVHDAEAAMSLGVNSGWCIAGRYGHYNEPNFKPSLKDAKRHFSDYASKGIKFYYFLDAKTMEAQYCIALYRKLLLVKRRINSIYVYATNFELYNAADRLAYDKFNTLPTQLIKERLIVETPKLSADGTLLIAGTTVTGYIGNPKTIKIPEGVIDIGYKAFANCTDLRSIEIPDSVATIGDLAFIGCRSLTNIKIPEGAIDIGYKAFSHCVSLTNILIPDSVTRIGAYAFDDCASLTSITIPERVTGIEECTFIGCSSLTSITIPAGTRYISYGAFYGCSNLTSIVIPEGVTSIRGSAFFGCSSLTSITLPAALRVLGNSVFADSGLKVATIPGSINIEDYGFKNCESLTEVTIREGVERIERQAFAGCKNLRKLILPSSLDYIAVDAFAEVHNLQELYYNGTQEQLNQNILNRVTIIRLAHFAEHFYVKDKNGQFVDIINSQLLIDLK